MVAPDAASVAGGQCGRPGVQQNREIEIMCTARILFRRRPMWPTIGSLETEDTMTDMNRRHFLMSTAALAAGSATRGLASPNDTVRMAVVGCGGRGGSHVSGWPSVPNVEIVALCDV